MQAITTTPTPFEFPREYYFPPFFTRQTNLATHHAQLVKWSSLVLAYCRHHRIFKLSLSAATAGTSSSTFSSSTAAAEQSSNTNSNGTTSTDITTSNNNNNKTTAPEDLFHNKKLNRRLGLSDAREVIDFLRRDGRAEYYYSTPGGGGGSSANNNNNGTGGGGGGGGGGGDVVWVFWRTPEEWASMVEDWVDETAQRGTVLTLYELVEGDGTRGTEFHGLDPELLQKALNVLVKRGKAQIFGQEDSLGVKFF